MRVVMTGATSGFGLEAARLLLDQGGIDLEVGARNPAQLPGELEGRDNAHALDLASLESVRHFADSIGDQPIDTLVLNAGLQLAKERTADNGMELTFMVNQLSHFLLLLLVKDRLKENARVIFTGSGTHDPEEGTPVTPPDHADADLLAYPEKDPTLPKGARPRNMRAYSSSKLCNIMTALELARREPGLTVMSFDPGYVPGTGLSREYPKILQKIVGFVIPLMMKNDRSSTIENSGRLFADVIASPDYDGARGDYWSVRGGKLALIPPSELARDEPAAAKLWSDCEKLAGIA